METSSSAKFLATFMVSSAWWIAEFCPCFCWGNIPSEGLQDSPWYCWTCFAPLPAAGSGCQAFPSFLPWSCFFIYSCLCSHFPSEAFFKNYFEHQLHFYHIWILPVSAHSTRGGQCPCSVTCPVARPGGPSANQFNQQTCIFPLLQTTVGSSSFCCRGL